jgi:hypothetical protein
VIAELRAAVAAAIEERVDPAVTVAAASPDALAPPAVAVDTESLFGGRGLLDDIGLTVTILPFADLTNPAHADERDVLVEQVNRALRSLKLEDAAVGDWRGDARDMLLGGVTHRAFVFTVPVTTPAMCNP